MLWKYPQHVVVELKIMVPVELALILIQHHIQHFKVILGGNMRILTRVRMVCVSKGKSADRKGNIVRAGTNWWNGGNGREGFQTGQTPLAPAIVCWSNHVAILEKIEGSTAYISEGGTGYSDAAHGYCGIFTTNVSNIASRNAGF